MLIDPRPVSHPLELHIIDPRLSSGISSLLETKVIQLFMQEQCSRIWLRFSQMEHGDVIEVGDGICFLVELMTYSDVEVLIVCNLASDALIPG